MNPQVRRQETGRSAFIRSKPKLDFAAPQRTRGDQRDDSGFPIAVLFPGRITQVQDLGFRYDHAFHGSLAARLQCGRIPIQQGVKAIDDLLHGFVFALKRAQSHLRQISRNEKRGTDQQQRVFEECRRLELALREMIEEQRPGLGRRHRAIRQFFEKDIDGDHRYSAVTLASMRPRRVPVDCNVYSVAMISTTAIVGFRNSGG